jgi:hypothetical protein
MPVRPVTHPMTDSQVWSSSQVFPPPDKPVAPPPNLPPLASSDTYDNVSAIITCHAGHSQPGQDGDWQVGMSAEEDELNSTAESPNRAENGEISVEVHSVAPHTVQSGLTPHPPPFYTVSAMKEAAMKKAHLIAQSQQVSLAYDTTDEMANDAVSCDDYSQQEDQDDCENFFDDEAYTVYGDDCTMNSRAGYFPEVENESHAYIEQGDLRIPTVLPGL